MKRSGTFCWSKVADNCTNVIVTDYYFTENGVLEALPELDDRFFCGPSEDIWKKFELLPTPPRSPSRPSNEDDDYIVPEPKLQLVSDLLDSPDPAVWGSSLAAPVGLKNDLLHDCMWSGQCRETCKRVTVDPLCQECSAPQCIKIKSEPLDVEVETNCGEAKPSPTLFVDPCTMLPYTPLSDHSYHTQQEEQEPRSPPFCDTPSDTEDDEIDVVTLPTPVGFKPIKKEPVERVRCPFQSRGSRSLLHRPRSSSPKVPPLKVVLPTSSLLSSKQGSKERKGRKRPQKRLHSAQRRKGRRKNPHLAITPPSSDCEQGGGRRSMHNTMERDRRLALKSAFTRLRANVPALDKCSKTPKVMILNSAAAYLRELTQKDQELEKKKEKELRRRAELQRRLNQLRSLQ